MSVFERQLWKYADANVTAVRAQFRRDPSLFRGSVALSDPLTEWLTPRLAPPHTT
jgi:hypothetical protein